VSAFRPKVKAVDSRMIAAAYDKRKITRMLLNGSSEAHVFKVLSDRKKARKAKKENREMQADLTRQFG
jgi:hypothetical protein